MTPKQKELFDFIKSYVFNNDGISPSFDEMRIALNLKSKSGVHRLVHSLAERGYITYLPHRARSIEVNGDINDNSSLKTELENVYDFLEYKGLNREFEHWNEIHTKTYRS